MLQGSVCSCDGGRDRCLTMQTLCFIRGPSPRGLGTPPRAWTSGAGNPIVIARVFIIIFPFVKVVAQPKPYMAES